MGYLSFSFANDEELTDLIASSRVLFDTTADTNAGTNTGTNAGTNFLPYRESSNDISHH